MPIELWQMITTEMRLLLVLAAHGLLASLITLLGIKALIYFSPALKLIDYPLGRKGHKTPTPLVGGISIAIGVSYIFFISSKNSTVFLFFWLSSIFVLALGIIDDRDSLRVKTKLIIHSFITLFCIYFSTVQLNYFGAVITSTPIYLGIFGPFLTVFLMLAFINAINMLDGVDGLVGSLVATQAFSLLSISILLHQPTITLLLVGLICAISSFLFYNFPLSPHKHARIFLGDAGSTFLAFFIAWITIYLSQETEIYSIKPIQIFWCVFFPFLEICGTVALRKANKQRITLASYDHIHFILLKMGFSRKQVVFTVCLISGLYSLLGIVLAWLNIPENIQFLMMWTSIVIYIKTVIRLNALVNKAQSCLLTTMPSSSPLQ